MLSTIGSLDKFWSLFRNEKPRATWTRLRSSRPRPATPSNSSRFELVLSTAVFVKPNPGNGRVSWIFLFFPSFYLGHEPPVTLHTMVACRPKLTTIAGVMFSVPLRLQQCFFQTQCCFPGISKKHPSTRFCYESDIWRKKSLVGHLLLKSTSQRWLDLLFGTPRYAYMATRALCLFDSSFF